MTQGPYEQPDDQQCGTANHPGTGPYSAQQHPGTGPYSTEQYPGTAPYPTGQYPPTGQLPASGQLPHTGEFPQYYDTGQFPASGGFGVPPLPPAQRSRGQRLTVVLSLVAIVAVVAAVVVIVLVNHHSAESAAPTTSQAQPTAPAPTSTTAGPPTTQAAPASPDTTGWHKVHTTSGLTYSVPPNWKASPKTRATGRGDRWGGVAEVGNYPCAGSTYTRGFLASGKAPASGQDPSGVAAMYAKSLAEHWYPQPQVSIGRPRPATVDGKVAVEITADLTITPHNPDCDATTGEVVVLAVQLDDGVALLAAVNDLTGGPAEPACVPDELIQEIVATAAVD